MKRTIFIYLCLFFICAAYCSNPVEEKSEFSIELDFRKMSGYTLYQITSSGWDPVSGEFEHGKSELEFPLDITMTGIMGALHRKSKDGKKV